MGLSPVSNGAGPRYPQTFFCSGYVNMIFLDICIFIVSAYKTNTFARALVGKLMKFITDGTCFWNYIFGYLCMCDIVMYVAVIVIQE